MSDCATHKEKKRIGTLTAQYNMPHPTNLFEVVMCGFHVSGRCEKRPVFFCGAYSRYEVVVFMLIIHGRERIEICLTNDLQQRGSEGERYIQYMWKSK